MTIAGLSFTNDNEYYTPQYIINYFGPFDYDPATTPDKAKECKIPNYDTIETNGLNADWTQYRRIWINPPFTQKYKFMEKAWQTFYEVTNEMYILMPIGFLTTKQFHNLFVGGGSSLTK